MFEEFYYFFALLGLHLFQDLFGALLGLCAPEALPSAPGPEVGAEGGPYLLDPPSRLMESLTRPAALPSRCWQ